MSENQLSITKKAGRRYDILVLLPLGLITIFSFGFVLFHPYYNPNSAQSAKRVSDVDQESNTSNSTQQHEVVNVGTPLQHISPTTQAGSQANTVSQTTGQASSAPTTSQTYSQKIQSQLRLLTAGDKAKPIPPPSPAQKLKDELNAVQKQIKAGLNL
ncbi:MAG: hypothetical protein ACHQT9_03770 [Candidatus Saccharimonadales bacterium]